MTRGLYYDRQGNEITDTEEWTRLHGDIDYKRVAFDELPNGRTVSTVWLGVNHNFSGVGPPIIFETMVFAEPGSYRDLDEMRYATEADAIAGHAAMVALWMLDDPAVREPS